MSAKYRSGLPLLQVVSRSNFPAQDPNEADSDYSVACGFWWLMRLYAGFWRLMSA
jgi:hypothetical protein